MKEKILEYEKRLLEDRQRLIELTEESKEENSLLLRNKLYYFQQELNYMNGQLEALKKQEAMQSRTVSQEPDQQSWMNYPVSQLVKQRSATNPVSANRMSSKSSEKKDIETTIGKSWMGIFASVLIFISLILFATVVLRNMGDMVKVAAIYLVSIAFTVAGLYKMQKDRSNHFYVAIAGCGVGAIYISLFLTNVYFKMIDDINLYLLLAVWAVGVCLLAKYQNRVFQVIGQCGVTIAVIFGCMLCVATDDIMKLVVLTVFWVVASNLFYIISFQKEFRKNCMHHIFHLINGYTLYHGCTALIGMDETADPLMLMLLIIAAIHIGVIFRNRWEARTASYGVVTAGYSILIVFLTS